MGLKFKLFAAYGVALFISHFWMGYHETPDTQPFFSGSETDGRSLYVLFGRVGGLNPELGSLMRGLAARENTAVWQAESGAVSVRELATAIDRSGSIDVHLVGIGYGSIDALELADELETRSSSLVLVSPSVSSRFELLGDTRLNKALKSFQLAWFWILETAVPHFGYSDLLPYNFQTARRTFDADQSNASELFYRASGPLMILHPEGGHFEQSGALEAYQSIRPDATIGSYEDPSALLEQTRDNTHQTENGSLTDGVTARFEDFSGVQLGAVWGGFLLAVSTFASEDFACIGGGLLAAGGGIDLMPAIIGCLLGIFFGDLGIYFIGRAFGATALELPVLRHLVSAKSLNRSSDWFEKRGVALIVLTRFFPGSRVPTYFAAGVVKVSWMRFTLALLLAAALWTPILVLASYFLGEVFLELFESMGAGGWLGIVALIVCFAVGVRFLSKFATWKGRRLLYSSWRRLIGWEFWPVWAVYAPVGFQIVWLSLRYRSLSLPFSVNPCMPASGLVYESKIQILSHLEKSGVPIARFEAIRLEEPLAIKLRRLKQFMDRLGIEYPIVLKPDVGQRGQGVEIAYSEADAIAFFEAQEEDTIAQEYVGGTEYGVFYQRFAGRDQGQVTSITDKRTTWVVGDGVSSLETLILRDKRAVCMARFFLEEFESQLDTVPADGENFMLASIGTHCRGALFLDGADLITPELSAEVDRFSRGVEGFHFGRYDLRVPSEDALKRGEGIKVIELNGITSEPTNMYDPKHGPFFGWSSLMRQWRAIFALAKENRLAGHEPVSKRMVIKLAVGHIRGIPSRDLA
ncbi:VTT domain-containing protein [Pelagicoccus sp. SDUM812002]|uniref:VTT domain-containing protein n=1 Tax=Pelagicoccus sp. SDUM812002 TaxID=3041266 RepID=UPI00280D924A|nr:VTT domain-containing protein [Pelagicoccus sp. SDUM812002]MDQ8185143.1 VTT domain-containing protein [Pelagicoccus sp. SDUM812002]